VCMVLDLLLTSGRSFIRNSESGCAAYSKGDDGCYAEAYGGLGLKVMLGLERERRWSISKFEKQASSVNRYERVSTSGRLAVMLSCS
jgi:hypothetical protein